MTRARRVGGGVLALGGIVALALLSAGSWTAEESDHAVLRLAWRVRGVRVESCRALTPDELAALPAHMRQDTVCVGQVLPYHLTVNLDGVTLVTDSIRAAGARSDRPLFVSRSLPAPAGTYRLQIIFERDATEGAVTVSSDRPARLAVDTTVVLERGTITLVTYDPDGRRLVLRRATPD